jgi:putative membrane protein
VESIAGYGGVMEIYKSLMRMGLVAILLSLLSVGCQRSNEGVQAAREDKSKSDRTTTLTTAEKRFIIDAERDDIKERSLARVVVEKSTNDDVKDYAKMLVNDHTKALRDLVDLMTKAGMNQPGGLPEVKHEAQDQLNKLSGPAFDREYINLMVQDHKKAIAKFQQEETTAQDESVRNYVKQVLPVLQKHLNKALELQAKLNSQRT